MPASTQKLGAVANSGHPSAEETEMSRSLELTA